MGHNGEVTDDFPPTTFRTVWTEEEEHPPRPVNQITVQVGIPVAGAGNDGLVYLRLGHTDPPVLMGTDEERKQQIQALGGVLPVMSYGRFVMSRARAREILKVISDFLDQTEGGSSHAE
jgi:hypothetical protein